jgi:hypothetical protein
MALSLKGGIVPTLGASGGEERGLPADPWGRLKAWQTRLSEHFARLAATRLEAGWPVFALEHGLRAGEREALAQDVRACVSVGPDRSVSLPWIVYAAEIGYEYSGYEYWQTFESKTPGWQSSWRERIRARFGQFAKTYQGAEPDGDWANHFSIIAWPITHGILPRDLQRQLAELLFEASMSFREDTFSSAESLGRQLQSRATESSSRFRQFAENATLLGQITLALLLQQDAGEVLGSGTGAIIQADALARIVDDLNRERDAKQWLAAARSAARFRVRGLARIPLRGRIGDSENRGLQEARHPVDDVASTLPRPRLLLRERVTGEWQVRLQLPNLAHLVGRFPRARDVHTRAQGRVGGPAGPVLARGRIVTESWPEVTLSVWPTPQTPLLSFDGAPPELESVLRAGFRIGGGDRWLFTIGSDGQARELATRVLRAGESYLLLQLTETRNPVAGLGIQPVRVACTGIHGLRIDVPATVSETLAGVLRVLGLEVGQTLNVWPAGLPVSEWSGDGRGEWVNGAPIVLGIRVDRRVERLTIAIDGVPQPEILPPSEVDIGAPIFVQLPVLHAGLHWVSMVAETAESPGSAGGSFERSGQPRAGLRGELQCVVREPRTATVGQAGALSFVVRPAVPSLEDVWEDRIELSVAAPGESWLRCRMVLQGQARRELVNRVFRLPSPCDTETWRREFAPARKAAEEQYDDAQLCLLEFDAKALGRARIVAERDFTALRWAVRGNGHRAVLVDSQGSADLSVCRIRCVSPSLEQTVDASEAFEGIEIADGGALVIARSRGLEAATVVVPPQRLVGLAALTGERPHVPSGPRDVASVHRLVCLAARWERARLAGSSLAEPRRSSAVAALVSRLTGTIAGGRWAEAEDVLRDRGSVPAAEIMRERVTARPDERAAVVVLSEKVLATATASMLEAERALINALKPFIRVADIEMLASFALRLASSPSAALTFVGGANGDNQDSAVRERALLDRLLESPVVLRAARYFVIATSALLSTSGRMSRALPWTD